MAETPAVEMKRTIGLTGLTMNAMALIAPGAFLWFTFYIQATTGTTAPAMWRAPKSRRSGGLSVEARVPSTEHLLQFVVENLGSHL